MLLRSFYFFFFFFNDTATTEIYTLSLHDALPISASSRRAVSWRWRAATAKRRPRFASRPIIARAVIFSKMVELLAIERLRVRFRAVSLVRAWLAGIADPMIAAVADVSLAIPAGGAFGLVGEGGSGKTTLGRAIVGLVPAKDGTIRLAGTLLPLRDRVALRAWRRQVAMTFQDPIGSLSPRLTVRALVSEPFRVHGIGARSLDAEARRLLALVGLAAPVLDRYPHELSRWPAPRGS